MWCSYYFHLSKFPYLCNIDFLYDNLNKEILNLLVWPTKEQNCLCASRIQFFQKTLVNPFVKSNLTRSGTYFGKSCWWLWIFVYFWNFGGFSDNFRHFFTDILYIFYTVVGSHALSDIFRIVLLSENSTAEKSPHVCLNYSH